MTRILYWNIEHFNSSKISGSPESDKRMEYILNDIFLEYEAQDPDDEDDPVRTPPDIFIIVEPMGKRTRDSGKLNMFSGGNGTYQLLKSIRTLIDGRKRKSKETWCLVPPILTGWDGYQESVAVYYNTDKLQFTGPFVWNNEAEQAQPPIVNDEKVPAGEYPSLHIDWSDALPDRVLPALGNSTNENTRAGQWWWPRKDADGKEIPFNPANSINDGLNFPSAWHRKPFLTQFKELTGEARTLNIYAIHTSPNTKERAVKNLENINEIRIPPAGDGIVDIIIGDFNVDSFKAFNQTNRGNAYYKLINDYGFSMCFPPYRGDYVPGIAVDDELMPFRLTHFLPCPAWATPFRAPADPDTPPDPTHNVTPRLGYMGNTKQQSRTSRQRVPTDSGAIDNVLVRYSSGGRSPDAKSPTIVNTVVGSDSYYSDNNDLDGELFNYTSTLSNPLDTDEHGVVEGVPDDGSQESNDTRNTFIQDNNLQFITKTSDHLPLIVEI